MPSAGFEPAIPASERRQTYASDGAATGTGPLLDSVFNFNSSAFLFLKAVFSSRASVEHSYRFREKSLNKYTKKKIEVTQQVPNIPRNDRNIIQLFLQGKTFTNRLCSQ